MNQEKMYGVLSSIRDLYLNVFGTFNDETTRTKFKEDVLRELFFQHELYDVHVVCDLRNNPPSVIVEGGFKFDILIKENGVLYAITEREVNRELI